MVLTREDRMEISNLIKSGIEACFKDDSIMDKLITKMCEKVEASLTQRLQKYDEELDKLKREREQIKDKYIELEQYSRRNNVRIFGIPEDDNEEVELKLINALSSKNINIASDFIDRCHRVGHKKKDLTRAILVKFTSYKYKSTLLKNRTRLQELRIKEDLAKERYELLKAAAKMCGLTMALST